MKILLVNDYSERVGGTETYLESLEKELTKLGHEVSTYNGSDNFKFSVQNRKSVNGYLKRIFNLKHYIEFKKKLDEIKPDIIHLHNIFNEISPSILLRTKEIPVIMTIHDYQIIQAVFNAEERSGEKCKKEICPGCLNCVGFKGMIYEKIKRILHKPLIAKIDVFIAPSNHMQNTIAENSEYRPVTVFNGFNFGNAFSFHGKSNALYTGRLTNDKGIQYFLSAIPTVLKVLPEFKAVIAGEGELKKDLIKSVNALKIQKVVSFVGYLTKEKVFEEYKKCSIVVVPSIWPENLPTVCIEALSCGRAVIASNVGGIPEIVKNGINGELVLPKNVSALSKKIIEVLEDQKRLKRYSIQAPLSLDKFNMGKHVNELQKIYSSTVN